MEEKDQKIADLEEKLAESEEQCRDCKHLNKKIELNIKNKLMAENCELQKQLAEKEKQDQDKISFAIEQLEKVYEYTANVFWVDCVSEVVCNFIDQQIKKLKEKTNVKN